MNPKVRTQNLLIEQIGDEVVIYDRENNKSHLLNKAAAVVWRQSTGSASIEEVTKSFCEETGLDADADVVLLALRQFREARLLEEGPVGPDPSLTRRSIIKRFGLGIGAAALVPLVESVTAPSAAQAQSGSMGTTTEAPPKESTVAPF